MVGFVAVAFLALSLLTRFAFSERDRAEENLRHAPVEINHASRAELLRVPGIGPKGADAIVQGRRTGHFTELSHLRRIGIRQAERAAPYLLLDGRAPAQQLPLKF